ncbi:MAG: cytochrome-c oxidase, cbb3-type subunit III [Rickettsiales bacterium]|nr:cytochrome-c oxidase, cbb3-type subunit III [Rickettsiales bacterium]
MTDNKDNKNQDQKKKVEASFKTTGHEWDGISEYNIPAPRWWLIVWIVCIIWSVVYWFFYPTWPIPGGNSKGSLNWSGTSQLKESQQEIEALKNVYLEKFAKSSFEQIQQDHELIEFAKNGGRAAFKENCAACHGLGAQGAKGYPNLNDDDWLWGGKIEDIYTTLKYGIRSGHEKARSNQMPSFGLDKILNKEEIGEVVEYVMSLSGKASHNAKGEEIFKANCVACHGAAGKGNRELGAPNLSDAIWLYGGTKEEITYTVNYAHAGVMPYWTGRLDEQTIKQLAIYVHSLGGGE